MKPKSMSVLMVGVDSNLGQALRGFFLDAGYRVFRTTRQKEKAESSENFYLDLCKPEDVNKIPEVDYVILLAGITGEQSCQENPDLSRALNVESTVYIAEKFASRGSFVLFISSSRVFDGRIPSPTVSDTMKPRGIYGQLKAEAEKQILQLDNVAVLRLTKVAKEPYALAEDLSSRLRRGENLTFSSKSLVSPLAVEEVFRAVELILRRRASGLHQLGGDEQLTEADYFRTLLREFPEVLEKLNFDGPFSSWSELEHNSLTTSLPTLEEQYGELPVRPRITWGLMSGHAYMQDPKRLAFTLSRYKFVSKLFAGTDSVLEVGCADAFGSALVGQEVRKLVATDFDLTFISDAKKNHPYKDTIDFRTHDFLEAPIFEDFDAAFALDVLEHIPKDQERAFLGNIVDSLSSKGMCVVGTPSLESQQYASEISKRGHVNCKTGKELKAVMSEFFDFVFLFSMNDEVVHTGFAPMSHYLLALGCQKTT